MPDMNTPDGVQDALKPDDGVSIPRMNLKEVGFVGLKTSSGQILAEAQKAFRYPAFIPVVNEIRNNPTVGAAMNVYRFMIGRKKWKAVAPIGSDPKLEARANIVTTMMHDMDDSWADFIQSVIPYLEYGFSIHSIVPYRRLKRNGSKHNDGLVGIKKLALRNQDTIARWTFSDDGRELLKVEQSLANLEYQHLYQDQKNEHGYIDIPRETFLLFTSNSTAGNPQGNSIYKNIYLAHKRLTLLQDQQLLTAAKEAKGLLKIELPPEYLQGADSPDGGAAAEAFKKFIDGHNNGTNSGLLVPRFIDPETKINKFDYSLMESKGTLGVDLDKAIQSYKNDILQALNVDVLALGASGSGSFALAENKTSILALAVDSRLQEIKSVLDKHLMKYIFERNGWSTEVMPEFIYEDEEDIDMEVFGAYIQKIFSTGAIEVDRKVLNKVRKVMGVEELPDDMPIQEDMLSTSLSGKVSRSGDGMAVGTSGNGTAKIGGNSSTVDPSTANVSNK